MRPRHLITILALGLAARAIYRLWRARRADADTAALRIDEFEVLAIDPRDPVQGLDDIIELEPEPLDVDAMSRADADAADDLAELDAALDEAAGRDATTEPVRRRDAGELYGAHTPAAADREHADDDQAFADGQNWREALETSAIENGPEPERSLDDIVDDEDVLRPPHPTLGRDIPVADHGAGGRRGL